MIKKFVFVVHPLSEIHQKILGFRIRKWDVMRSFHIEDPKNIATVASFTWKDGRDTRVVGEVVAIPLLPEQIVQDPDLAIERIVRAVNFSARDGIFPDAVGLGSLCAVIGGRGSAIQELLPIPVTTGNAGTAWCMFQNAKTLHEQYGGDISVIGANSPVGTAVVKLFDEEGIIVCCDSKKAGRKTKAQVETTENAVVKAKIIVGCSSTGPIVQAKYFRENSHLVDVAIPSSVEGKLHPSVQVYAGESMSFSSQWNRGSWGPLYHMVSGYGLQSVLACMIEPVVLVHSQREKPYALGRKLSTEDIRHFGQIAHKMGFKAKIRKEYGFF